TGSGAVRAYRGLVVAHRYVRPGSASTGHPDRDPRHLRDRLRTWGPAQAENNYQGSSPRPDPDLDVSLESDGLAGDAAGWRSAAGLERAFERTGFFHLLDRSEAAVQVERADGVDAERDRLHFACRATVARAARIQTASMAIRSGGRRCRLF